MNCALARKLFGACWDDEVTQAEREALESHFTACPSCRAEYDQFSRSLELLGSLPRIEAGPDLVERVVARSRRIVPAPDRVGAPGIPWVPATAAAALLVLTVTLVSPWIVPRPTSVLPLTRTDSTPIRQPELRADVTSEVRSGGRDSRASSGARSNAALAPIASVPDSLFDHTEDVEFILDPMTLHRGRPAAVRARGPVQGQQATITF